jgi:hypothetical protein
VLEVEVGKYLDTSLIKADVQPGYIRWGVWASSLHALRLPTGAPWALLPCGHTLGLHMLGQWQGGARARVLRLGGAVLARHGMHSRVLHPCPHAVVVVVVV